MYKGYWPNAIVIDRGRTVRMFTYDSCTSLKKAQDCIKVWNEIYDGNVIASYIEHSWDKKKVCCKFYEKPIAKNSFL